MVSAGGKTYLTTLINFTNKNVGHFVTEGEWNLYFFFCFLNLKILLNYYKREAVVDWSVSPFARPTYLVLALHGILKSSVSRY